jgi:hypothetical protein
VRGCEECLKIGRWRMHLCICRQCGHVGCCGESLGKHASAHFHTTRHPIMEAYDPSEGCGWCYVDEGIRRPSRPNAAIRPNTALRVMSPSRPSQANAGYDVECHDPYDRPAQTFPKLPPEMIDWIKHYGRPDNFDGGACLFRVGDRNVDFFLSLEGPFSTPRRSPLRLSIQRLLSEASIVASIVNG